MEYVENTFNLYDNGFQRLVAEQQHNLEMY